MTKKELSLIAEVVTKAVLNSLSVYVRKIVREELEISSNMLTERVNIERPIIKQQKKRSNLSQQFFGDTFKEIIEGTRSKVKFPTTGNEILDDIISSAPSERELVQRTVVVPNSEPIPMEEIYLNDVKKITPQLAENIDYSEFLDKMEASKGSPIAVPGINPRMLYAKDKDSIVQEQRTGETKIIKEYKG